MAKNKGPNYSSLAECLTAAAREGRRIKSSVILTYEFDPTLVESLAASSLLTFDDEESTDTCVWTGDFPCALFYDPRCTQLPARLPGNFEINYWAKGAFSCHHSKAYAFVFDDGSAELILGSFNLTTSGISANRELLMDFEIRKGNAEHLNLFRQWLQFVQTELKGRAKTSAALNQYVLDLSSALESFSDGEQIEEDTWLLPSGYGNYPAGLTFLTDKAKELGINPTTLLFVSPFLDAPGNSDPVCCRLTGGFKSIQRIIGFTKDQKIPAGLFPRGFERKSKERSLTLYAVNSAVEEEEKAWLEQYLDRSLDAVDRTLHAKMLLLLDDAGGDGLIYIGSANFTNKAWGGGNCELGVLKKITLSQAPTIPALRTFVEKLLGAVVTEVRAEAVAEVDTDPEDDGEKAVFPSNLASVTLKVDHGRAAQDKTVESCFFEFQTTDGAAPQGAFFWNGEKLTLRTSGGIWRSQGFALTDDVRQRIGMTRALEWSYQSETAAVPFNLQEDLGVALQFSVSEDSADALEFVSALLRTGRPPRVPVQNEKRTLKRQADDGTAEEESLVNRDANLVVLMQHRIAVLAEIEKLLLPEQKTEGDQGLSRGIQRVDLPAFFTHMSRLYARDTNLTADARCFLCGELLRLGQRITRALDEHAEVMPSAGAELLAAWQQTLMLLGRIFDETCQEEKGLAKAGSEVLKWYRAQVRGMR